MQMKEQSAEPASTILVDIRDVSVSKELPREERISEFIRQIKDPYCFKCGRFTVRASFLRRTAQHWRTASRESFAEQRISKRG